jgi:outer membrane beta-barrel protein
VKKASLSVTAVAMLTLLAGPTTAEAGEEQRYAGTSIQQRKYQLFHEFSLSAGVMPLDPYQKSWTASFAYTFHFSQNWSWEVVQATYAFALSSTSLRDELIRTFAVPPEEFAAPRLMLTSGLEYSPFYNKQVFMNDGVLHSGLLFGGYGGVIFGDRGDIASSLEDFRPSLGLGIGFRFFVEKWFSTRVDLRQFFSFRRAILPGESFKVEPVLFITISGSFNLWRDDA